LTLLVNGRHLSGWKPDKPDHRDFPLTSPFQALPAAFSLRDRCPNIFDQGSLGTCTANAWCAAMAYLEGLGLQDREFSRLFVYWYTRVAIEGGSGSVDSGAENRDVAKALAQFGACWEDTWPYIESNFSVPPPDAAVAEAALHKALFYYRCPDLDTLKSSIVQPNGSPVVIGFSVPDNMMGGEAAATGEIHFPGIGEGFRGGHAVLAAAFDDARKIGDDVGAVGGPNSWGPDWGDRGWFWLPYRFFQAGLCRDFWALRAAQV
jgi:C1A family cysteine protease